jgi:pre-mRNA-splicing factor CWC22
MAEKDRFKRPLDAAAVYVPPAKRLQLRLEQEEKQRQLEEKQKAQAEEGKNGGNEVREEGQEEEQNGVKHDNLVGNNIKQNQQHLATTQQRETWQEQRRVINGTINRLNSGTIKPLIQDLFQKVNLIRLRGPLCKSVLSAAISSPKYSDVYAAIIAVVNSKLPEVGELMVKRAILSFRRYYKQRDKASCQAVCVLLVHLFHQGVVHELIILQLLSVLLDGSKPTDDSVEVAVHVLQTAGQALLDSSSAGVRACTERMRSLLHEGHLNHRVEYRVEELLKARKNGFKDFPSIIEELDLVERDDQITFEITLDDDDIQKEDELDVFSFDSEIDEHEAEWKAIRAEILGEGDSSDDDDSDSDDGSDDDSSDDGDDEEEASASGENADTALVNIAGDATSKQVAVVEDLTEADLVHLRRTIYLTIMSSATFEECAHKLARIEIPPGRELELINMLIECCSQERTFLRYYGLIASRFCLLDDRWKDAFMMSFSEQYSTIHRLETNKLRNVAKLFAHLIHTDSMPWSVMHIIHLNEDETTSSSRIFIKIVIQEMAEAMGIAKLKRRFDTQDDEHKLWYAGMFPKDNVRNTRYAINFFTSIGLGPLTDDLREFLKNAPKLILAQAKLAAQAKKDADSGDESSSVSSDSSSSSTSSSSSSSYTSSSSSSYSSSSSSSSSSSGRSRGRGRGRSRGKSRGRRRRYSSDSSSSSSSRSYSSSSSSSRSSDVSRSSRNRRGKGSRARSPSPPKVILKEKENRDRRSPSRSSSTSRRKENPSSSSRRRKTGRSQSRSSSRSPSRSRRKERPSGRSIRRNENKRSQSPPKVISQENRDSKLDEKRSSNSSKKRKSDERSGSPPKIISKESKGKEDRKRSRSRSRSHSPPKIISKESKGKVDRKRSRSSRSRSR